MDLNSQKEQFSDAYVRAVAAVSGFTCYKPTPDVDSIDWCIAAVGGQGTTRSPRVELQLKCTVRAQAHDHDGVIRFPLKLKNYNDLRLENYQVPRILVLVVVPEEIENWLSQTEDELSFRHCGYWTSLRGQPDTDNTTSVTIDIPRGQVFDMASLKDMMKRIGEGDLP